MPSFSKGRRISNVVVDADLDMGAYDLKTDDVTESTAAAGVAVEGVDLKDNKLTIDPDGVIPNWEGALTLTSNTEQTNANSALLRARVDNALSISKVCYLINDGSGDVVYLEANGTSRGLHSQVTTPASQTGLSTNGLLKADKFEEFTANNGIDIDGLLLKDGNVDAAGLKECIVTTDTPGTPAEGHMRWDGTAHKLQIYSGTAWETVTSAE